MSEELKKVQFPARLVVSRYGEHLDPPAKVWADEAVLHDDGELAEALRFYRSLNCRGVPYTLTLAALDDVERVMGERWAEIDALRSFGRRPAAEPPVTASEQPAASLGWQAAVAQATELARAAFVDNGAVLGRLEAARELAAGRSWSQLGDQANTFVMGNGEGQMYHVNGRCQCGDYSYRHAEHGGWCKHRLGRALALRAEQLQKEAGGAPTSPACCKEAAEAAEDPQCTTEARSAQLDLSQVVEFQWLGLETGVRITYQDRWENRTDVEFVDLVRQAQALGWRNGLKAGWYNPAFESWRREQAFPVDYGRMCLYKS